MNLFDLIEEWVRGQDWLEEFQSCSLGGEHSCILMSSWVASDHYYLRNSGGSDGGLHSHAPMIVIPFRKGLGWVNLRIYVQVWRNCVFFRWRNSSGDTDYIVGSECGGVEDVNFLDRFEGAFRSEVDKLVKFGYQYFR